MRIEQARKEVAAKFGPNATIDRFNLCGTYYYQVIILGEIIGSASSPYRAICDAAETLNSAMIVKDSHFSKVLAHLVEIDAEWMRGRKEPKIETETHAASEPVAEAATMETLHIIAVTHQRPALATALGYLGFAVVEIINGCAETDGKDISEQIKAIEYQLERIKAETR